jgi:tRNA-specific 2-thiouridylase
MNIAALVSGGVDSSVVVHQLKEQGYNPTIFYIRIGMEDENGYMGCTAEEDIEITQFVAKKIRAKNGSGFASKRVLGKGSRLCP